MATREATWAYRDDHDEFARTFYRRFGDGVVSSIGIGTYLGDPTDERDASYHDAIVTALESGINVVDTAINYRHQRSERVVGDAVADADVDRKAIAVATKGGFIPFDGARPADPGAFVRSEYLDTGTVDRDDLVAGQHCIAPDYIDDQIDRSLTNLGLDTIDLYYVHNPETQLKVNSREAVYDQLEATFEQLEERAAAGDINQYGVATWEAFRVPADHDSHLSLPEIVERARAAAETVGNAATHLRAIQLPFNVAMADAFTVESHDGAEGPQSALWFAHEAGLDVFTSASIMQGQLAAELPDDVAAKISGETSAQRAINFARSAPGVTCSLVGTGSVEHARENVDAGRYEPLGADAFDAVFE
ncbi:aldo/keto reductase [Haloarcula marismortui]|uniref:Aldo/keto reductase n=1 Tax=Haloarcula marismortui ATCC 33800 TaxID=662476 RepID=M0K3H0_9EURY|nr:aldo/keto reductase [Haloarcula sinaiiensis]EMA15746.1 aldo/keto reductase [Haloarcula sinaiiensis ATCC 33800]QUJ72466.1 aldo/keto reductase [Haloarcula sinaiiensis ATCC 33800]